MKAFLISILMMGALASCGDANRPLDSNATPSLSEEDLNPFSDSNETVLQEEEANTSVQLSFSHPSLIQLTPGDDVQLNLNVLTANGEAHPRVRQNFRSNDGTLNGSVIWFSNNPDVVAVSQTGHLQALKEGKATIMTNILKATAQLEVLVSTTQTQATPALLRFDQARYALKMDSRFLTFDLTTPDGQSYQDVYADNLQEFLDCDLRLSFFHTDIAQILPSGLIVPMANGVANLVAQCGSLVARSVLVIDGFEGGEPEEEDESAIDEVVHAMRITNPPSVLAVGTQQQLNCEIRLNTGALNPVSSHFVTPQGQLGELVWQSLDPEVVEVSGGLLVARAHGTATIEVRYEDKVDTHAVEVKWASDDLINPLDAFLNAGDEFDMIYGERAGFGQESFPDIIFGTPKQTTHVVSFGKGGVMTIRLNDYVIVDGVGDDFTVFENAFEHPDGVFAERAQVSVSEDGENFFSFACQVDDAEGGYPGCAGGSAVNYDANPLDPEVSGGDAFDLGDLGLSVVRYVRITDLGTCEAGDVTYPVCATRGKMGFDLDALAVVNGVYE